MDALLLLSLTCLLLTAANLLLVSCVPFLFWKLLRLEGQAAAIQEGQRRLEGDLRTLDDAVSGLMEVAGVRAAALANGYRGAQPPAGGR